MTSGPATWSFGEEDAAAIGQTLQRFLRESGARCALVVDRSGQLVTTSGDVPGFDVTAFATLAAADFSANDQLARLIGESDFESLFHQGRKESMYLADVARRMILIALFDDRTTLGLVRLKIRPAVDELTTIFDAVFSRPRGTTARPPVLGGADEEIDALFNW